MGWSKKITGGKPRRTKENSLDEAATEASRLGMSYGKFQAMCYQKYPKCPRPITRYLDDKYHAAAGVGGDDGGGD